MQIRVNDLKAPRARGRNRQSILSKEFLSFLLEKHPDFPITKWTEFKDLCSKGLEVIADILATTREGIELPKMAGFILVGACEKLDTKAPDHQATLLHGKKVIYNNMHSDSRVAKILYTNYPIRYKVRYRELWQFEPCRFFVRHVSKRFKENPDNYIRLSKSEKLSWRFNKKHIINKKNYFK